MSEHIPQHLVETYRHHWFLAHFLGQRLSRPFQKVSAQALQQQIAEALKPHGPGRVLSIEKRKDLSLQEFRQVYLRLGIPVILRGAARHWPCVRHWTPEWLAERYGEDKMLLIDAAPGDIHAIDYRTREATLAEVIRDMNSKPLEKYARFNRLLYEHPELKNDFDRRWLNQHRDTLASGRTFQVFIGGKGSLTHLHAAAEHNLFTQVYGQKDWVMYPPSYDCVLQPPVNRTPYFHSPFNPDQPDFEAFPAMQYLDRYEFRLEPGDVFFNPPSWWHHVKNPTGSIGVGYRWFAPLNAFALDWTQALLTLAATNPPIWGVMRNRSDFARIFSVMQRKQQA